ncbi:hypothetical protein FKP32DRAFT_719539 [Trametes sanguinea]|nr:hypothetical protein FKP32DRAFT_719539 [Trametes sanguinea]
MRTPRLTSAQPQEGDAKLAWGRSMRGRTPISIWMRCPVQRGASGGELRNGAVGAGSATVCTCKAHHTGSAATCGDEAVFVSSCSIHDVVRICDTHRSTVSWKWPGPARASATSREDGERGHASVSVAVDADAVPHDLTKAWNDVPLGSLLSSRTCTYSTSSFQFQCIEFERAETREPSPRCGCRGERGASLRCGIVSRRTAGRSLTGAGRGRADSISRSTIRLRARRRLNGVTACASNAARGGERRAGDRHSAGDICCCEIGMSRVADGWVYRCRCLLACRGTVNSRVCVWDRHELKAKDRIAPRAQVCGDRQLERLQDKINMIPRSW